MRRHAHGLSRYQLLTGDMGYLYPINLLEVLPGDIIQMSSNALVRMSPLDLFELDPDQEPDWHSTYELNDMQEEVPSEAAPATPSEPAHGPGEVPSPDGTVSPAESDTANPRVAEPSSAEG